VLIHSAAPCEPAIASVNPPLAKPDEGRKSRASEKRYRGLLEAAPDAMVVVNQGGDIVLLNLQAEHQFGYHRDELLGQKVTNIIPEGFAERLVADDLRSAEDALSQQLGTGIELIGRRKDGSEFPIELMLSPLENAEGILVTAAIRNISVRREAETHLAQMVGERRLMEEALRESEERYRMLLDGIQNYAIFMMDPWGQVISWNAGAQRIKGYTADEIIGRNFSCFFPPGEVKRGRPEEALRLTAAGGRYEEQGMRVRKDGSRFLASVILTALRDPAGNLRGFAEFSHDLSESKESEAKYRGLLEAAPDAMVVVNQGGDIVLLNLQAEKQFGYHRDELLGQKVTNIIPEGFAERLVADDLRSAEDALSQQIGTGIELIGRRKDGSEFPIELMLSPLENAEGILVTAAIRDITERKQAAEALFAEKERAEVTLKSIGDAVLCTDIADNITFLNVAAEKITGWSWMEAAGQPITKVFQILDAATQKTTPNRLEMAARQDRTVYLPPNCILARHDGPETWIEGSASPIHDREGRAVGAIIIFRDVSTARTMALEMTHLAEHDFLTGLPNRILLNDRIDQAIALAHRNKKTVAVLFLDLDGFKHINDSLGHATGDKLLQLIAKCLVACVRGSDTVSRQGGDEFVVLLSEMEQSEDAAIAAGRIVEAMAGPHSIGQHELHVHGAIAARRMLKAVAEPHTVDHYDLHVTASIGISVYPDDGLDAETLIKNADTAMYQAKENGRQSYQFFEPEMNVRAVERQFIVEGLRRALARQEFVLHYQPIIDLTTGMITGAEALIRWMHPTRGLIPPLHFIPFAEDCGLIVPIGAWVLRAACTQARAWVDAGLPVMTMAVNVSALELRDENFLENLFAILSDTGLEPTSLVLELTESVLMKHAEAAACILQTLRKKGVKVAIDDFGTGYSSLSSLRKFPVDTLKIDQSFVRRISTAGGDAPIATAVINMAQGLKLRVIAEGVETSEELAFLQAHQCDAAQGYYFSRPVVAQQFAKLLKTGVPERDSVPHHDINSGPGTAEVRGATDLSP